MHYSHTSESRIPAVFGTSTLTVHATQCTVQCTVHMLPSISSPRSLWDSLVGCQRWYLKCLLLLIIAQMTPGCLSLLKAKRGYTLWCNLNYFLITIFLQERPPSSNGKEHCYCCSRSVEFFFFAYNVYQIYISLSEAISCKICLLMRLLFISCMLSFWYTTLRKAVDQEQTQQR